DSGRPPLGAPEGETRTAAEAAAVCAYVRTAAVRRPTRTGGTYASSCTGGYAPGVGRAGGLTRPGPIRSVLRVARREHRLRSVRGRPCRKHHHYSGGGGCPAPGKGYARACSRASTLGRAQDPD